MKQLIKELENILEKFKEELGGVRIGRASIGLVENLKVDYYGGKSPLKQVAQISVPDPKTIMITPWNRDDLSSIEKAISDSELHLTPNNNGEAVILILPPVTEERRIEMGRLISRKAEDYRVIIRQKRAKKIEELEKNKKSGSLPEDSFFAEKDKVQKIIDDFIKKIDQEKGEKEKELEL